LAGDAVRRSRVRNLSASARSTVENRVYDAADIESSGGREKA